MASSDLIPISAWPKSFDPNPQKYIVYVFTNKALSHLITFPTYPHAVYFVNALNKHSLTRKALPPLEYEAPDSQ